MSTSIGIIGFGDFGKLIFEAFSKFNNIADIRISSRSNAPGSALPYVGSLDVSDYKFFEFDEVLGCDFVFVCVPIRYYKPTLKKINERLKQNRNLAPIIIDVASVKEYPLEICKSLDLNYICTHPMFGMASYKRAGENIAGMNFVLCESNCNEKKLQEFRDLVSVWKVKLVELSATEHDQMLATTFFPTHLTSQLFKGLKIRNTIVDTYSFTQLKQITDFVSEHKEIFYDTYKYNSYCEKFLRNFSQHLTTLTKNLEDYKNEN